MDYGFGTEGYQLDSLDKLEFPKAFQYLAKIAKELEYWW
jgi:imidazoleglycerol-phosphate dehydratase/histidinol-phosphatase